MARAFKRSRMSNTGLGVDSVIRHVDPGTAAGQPASECLNVLCATGPPAVHRGVRERKDQRSGLLVAVLEVRVPR